MLRSHAYALMGSGNKKSVDICTQAMLLIRARIGWPSSGGAQAELQLRLAGAVDLHQLVVEQGAPPLVLGHGAPVRVDAQPLRARARERVPMDSRASTQAAARTHPRTQDGAQRSPVSVIRMVRH